MKISKSTLKKLIKEAALEYVNSQQNLLAEASDDGLKQLWSMFEDWHRYGMGRWD